MARRVGPPGPFWRKPPIGPRSLAARLTLAAFALSAVTIGGGGDDRIEIDCNIVKSP